MRHCVKYLAILLLVIFADQASKLWVCCNMEMGADGQINILGNLFKLTYVLNPGMAFNMHLGFKYGKLLVTTLRILLSLAILWHIIQSLKRSLPVICIFGWVLVLGGAIGNSIDSIFYGVYLDNAPVTAPMKWLHGQVIDMIHIDLWSGIMPTWVPIWGGFEVYCLPIFNIADIAIFIGLFIALYCARLEKNNIRDDI